MIASDENSSSSSSSRDLLDTTCHTQLPKDLQDTSQLLTPIKSSTTVIPSEKEECLICREELYNISCNDDDDDDDRVEEIVVMLPCAHRYVVVLVWYYTIDWWWDSPMDGLEDKMSLQS